MLVKIAGGGCRTSHQESLLELGKAYI